ncbi:flippase (plasmid) [Halorussus salilacus]|uniref:flippase n=1 Tax=Halorussus salilacus TaxID=2953750 RepID=UPI00209F1EE2|nr:flippase [Halorussus salilacus]USZ69745.1 flippase [Halorussus salilacus]
MNVARSSFKVFLAETVSVVLSFLAIMYYARELGAARLGTFFLFQATLFVLRRPADLGLRIAVQKRISEGSHPESVLTTSLLLKLGLLSLTIWGLLAVRGFVADYIGLDLTWFLVVALVLHELSSLMKNALSGELRVGETAIIDFVYNVVMYGGGVLLVYAGYGVVGLVVSVIAGLALRLVLAFRAVDTGFGRPSMERARSLAAYAKFTVVPSVGHQVHQWMDTLILGVLATNAAVGVYEVAWRIGGPVLLAAQSIGVAIFPQFSSWDSAGSRDSIERLFSRVLTPSMFLVFPAFFGTLVLAEEILTLVFDAEFGAAWLALIIIMAGKIPSGIKTLAGDALYGLNKPKYVTIATIVTITANFVLNVILISAFGIVGAATGTMVSVTIGMALRTYYLSRFIEIRAPYDELGWCAVSAAAMGTVLYAAKTVVPVETAAGLFGFVATGVVLYGAFVLLYPPLKDQISAQLREFVPGLQ